MFFCLEEPFLALSGPKKEGMGLKKKEDGQKQKNTFTFDNDGDVKALTDTLKWARIKSLRARGYKVVE